MTPEQWVHISARLMALEVFVIAIAKTIPQNRELQAEIAWQKEVATSASGGGILTTADGGGRCQASDRSLGEHLLGAQGLGQGPEPASSIRSRKRLAYPFGWPIKLEARHGERQPADATGYGLDAVAGTAWLDSQSDR